MDDDVVINLAPNRPKPQYQQQQHHQQQQRRGGNFNNDNNNNNNNNRFKQRGASSASAASSSSASSSFQKPSIPRPQKQDDNDNNDNDQHNQQQQQQQKNVPHYKRKVGEVKHITRDSVPEAPHKLATHQGTTTSASDTFSGAPFADSGISPDFLQHIVGTLDLKVMTHIQLATIPAMLKGTDILMKARTGTGKTLAFSIPIVQDLGHQNQRIERSAGTHALVVAPTRELCLQIDEVFGTLLKPFHWVIHGTIIGGEKKKSEKARLRKGLIILVGTPGRLLDHLHSTEAFRVSNLKYLVLDEADRLLDLGFEKDVMEIINMIDARRKHKRRQSVLVSATLDGRVKQLASAVLYNPKTVTASEASSQLILRQNGKRAFEEMQPCMVSDGNEPEVNPNHGDDEGEDAMEEQEKFDLPQRLRQHFVVVPYKQRLTALASFLRGRAIAAGSTKCLVFCSCIAVVKVVHYLLSRCWTPKWTYKADDDWTNQPWMDGSDQEDDNDGGNDDDDDDDMLYGGYKSLIQTKKKKTKKKEAAASSGSGGEELKPFLEMPLYVLHGDMPQQERTKAFFAFCHASSGVLFCTDVAARGLDFPMVDWIVQYDCPSDPKEYVHRVGRTARMTHDGDALLFLMPHEREYLDVLQAKNLVLQEISFDTIQGMILPKAVFTPTAAAQRKQTNRMAAVMSKKLSHQFEDLVSTEPETNKMATDAFLCFIRAYATHARDVKSIFHVKKIHLGHLAASFGLRDAPTIINRQTAPKKDKKRQRR